MKKRDKKLLLVFPPQWTPVSPHFAIPSLLGQLKRENFNAKGIDLNIQFYERILNKDYLNAAISGSKIIFDSLKRKLPQILVAGKSVEDYSLPEQIEIFRYDKIKKFFIANALYLNSVPNEIENAVNTLKSEDFYDTGLFIKALNTVDKALEIASLPYSPTAVNFDSVVNPFFKFNLENIKYFVFDKKTNIFYNYLCEKAEEIIKENPDFVAVSLNSSSQIVAGLTLTSLLKQKTKAHINIGGNFFGRIANELENHEDFFELFADSVSVEEGEGPIIELAKYINGEIEVSKVPNLLYRQDKKILKNPNMKPVKLNDIAPVNLDGYELNKYFAPQIVLPFQSSRGCYWGKCSFCDQDFGQNFNVKDVDKVVDEMKFYKNEYNIDKFEFIDESVSPTYMSELSDLLLKNDMNISYFCDARLESLFTKEILQNAAKSGLKMVMWGLESGSEKVMRLINKGIDLDKRFEILKNAKDAGIWNFAFIFFGFPAENVEDANKTIEMLVNNKDVIHSYGRSVFTMGRHSKLAEAPKVYGITKIYPAEEEFSPNINFDCMGMTKKELHAILTECKERCAKAYKNPLWMYLRYREWLFLYIDKYGSEYVSSYDVKEKLGLR